MCARIGPILRHQSLRGESENDPGEAVIRNPALPNKAIVGSPLGVTLLFGLLFGAIGSAYIVYGKRHFEPSYVVAGFALIVYPYFVSSALLTLLIGIVLILLPIARQREWF